MKTMLSRAMDIYHQRQDETQADKGTELITANNSTVKTITKIFRFADHPQVIRNTKLLIPQEKQLFYMRTMYS